MYILEICDTESNFLAYWIRFSDYVLWEAEKKNVSLFIIRDTLVSEFNGRMLFCYNENPVIEFDTENDAILFKIKYS
jgi:hypothetical protein